MIFLHKINVYLSLSLSRTCYHLSHTIESDSLSNTHCFHPSLSVSLSHAHTLSQSLFVSLPSTLFLSLSLSLSLFLSLSFSLSPFLPLCLSLSLFLPHPLSLSLSMSHSNSASTFSPLTITPTAIRNGTHPVSVGSVRESGNVVPSDSTYEGLADRARSQHRAPTSSIPPISPMIPEPDTPLVSTHPCPQGDDQISPTSPVRTAHTFGDGTCYPGSRSDLHNTIISELPLSSPLCGLLRDLHFEEIVDLAYMFNYNDDER